MDEQKKVPSDDNDEFFPDPEAEPAFTLSFLFASRIHCASRTVPSSSRSPVSLGKAGAEGRWRSARAFRI